MAQVFPLFEIIIEDTKTSSGTREIPMTDDVYQCFQRIIANRPKPKTEPMIVSVKTNSGFCQTARYGKMQPSLTESVRELEECNGT